MGWWISWPFFGRPPPQASSSRFLDSWLHFPHVPLPSLENQTAGGSQLPLAPSWGVFPSSPFRGEPCWKSCSFFILFLFSLNSLLHRLWQLDGKHGQFLFSLLFIDSPKCLSCVQNYSCFPSPNATLQADQYLVALSAAAFAWSSVWGRRP